MISSLSVEYAATKRCLNGKSDKSIKLVLNKNRQSLDIEGLEGIVISPLHSQRTEWSCKYRSSQLRARLDWRDNSTEVVRFNNCNILQ
jgi:hypothetical protein